jgi:hypothetical protein
MNMIYIYRLKDLNPKTADIESTNLLRSIKKRSAFPFTEKTFEDEFFTFFMSGTDKVMMQNSLDMIPSVIDELKFIASANNPVYELINFKRAISILNEIPEPLKNNLGYAEEIKQWSGLFSQELVFVLNNLRSLRNDQEKILFNQRLSAIFEKILRNKEMFYNAEGIVGEGVLEHITALSKSMANGFLFTVHLEEEIKKVNFDFLKQRIPVEELEKIERLGQKIDEIKKGVERAYENNMRMLQMAIITYSYVRWMITG